MPSEIPETDLPPETQGLAAWLRLTLIPGIGRKSQLRLLGALGLPEQIFSASKSAVREIIGDKKTGLIFETDVNAAIRAALLWAKEPGHHILTLSDTAYPPLLLQTPDPPVLLYLRGNPEFLKRPAVAIVGSRNATPQGLKTARDFAQVLSSSGFCIISGLALGIDAAAHEGALSAGKSGSSIAVIGTGADRLYPARNRELAQNLVARGLIISEFPLGTPAIAENFPRRNRIISGLSKGVLIVEAALNSGSLITARLAGEQGREVFAIPGSIHSALSRGCHQLIRQGAKLVESVQDILEELKDLSLPPAPTADTLPDFARTSTNPSEKTQNLPEKPALAADSPENQILTALGHDPCTLDELASRTGNPTSTLLALLMNMELEGRIASLPGNRYQQL